jgi:hypothetical protein
MFSSAVVAGQTSVRMRSTILPSFAQGFVAVLNASSEHCVGGNLQDQLINVYTVCGGSSWTYKLKPMPSRWSLKLS